MAHVDTVPICRGARPVKKGKYIVPADKHTALGADDRTGTAAILAAALYVLAEKPEHGPLTFLWTVQEEVGLYGARYGAHRHARPAKAGLQFRRRSHRQSDDRGHRRLSLRDCRLRHRQPRRRRARKGRQRNHRRRPGHRRPVPRGLAGENRKAIGQRHGKCRRHPGRRGHERHHSGSSSSAPRPAATTRLSAGRSSRPSKRLSRMPRGAS